MFGVVCGFLGLVRVWVEWNVVMGGCDWRGGGGNES